MKSRSLTVFALTLALLSTSAIASGLLASDADAMNPDEYVPPDSGLTYDVPERYDMRDDYGELPVRNQNGYGLCWSYASMASCEYLASKDAGDSGYFSPWYNVY